MFEEMDKDTLRERLCYLKNYTEIHNLCVDSPKSQESGDENVPSSTFHFNRGTKSFDQHIPISLIKNSNSELNTSAGSSTNNSRNNSPRKHLNSIETIESNKVNDIISVFYESDESPSSPLTSEGDLKTPSSPITSPNTFDVPCQPFVLLQQYQKLMNDPSLKKSENIPSKEIKPIKKRTKNQLVPRVVRCVCGSTTPGKGPTCKWRKGPSGELLCNSCGLQNMKKPKCPMCKKLYCKDSSEAEAEWISCDDCSQWVMKSCDGINDLTQPKPPHYSCPKCRNKRTKALKSQQSLINTTTQTTIQNSQNQTKNQPMYINRQHKLQTQSQINTPVLCFSSSSVLSLQQNSHSNLNKCILHNIVGINNEDFAKEIREYRETQFKKQRL